LPFAIRINGLDDTPDAFSVGHFVEKEPTLDMGNDSVLRANYAANLQLRIAAKGSLNSCLTATANPD
jgi:hypothetical protein